QQLSCAAANRIERNEMPVVEQGRAQGDERARVVFQPNGRQGDAALGMTLLDVARSLGVEIESICGGRQTCGKCKVLVEEGSFAQLGIRSAATHLTPAQE